MEHQNYQTRTATTDLFAEEVVEYAGFWERFGAVFIDGLILSIPNFLLKQIAGPVMGDILAIVMFWLYDAIQLSGSAQATIGKKALRIQVRSTDGEPVSFAQATGRHFGKYISLVILLIGYFMMLWDSKRQTLHDKMANTIVVKG